MSQAAIQLDHAQPGATLAAETRRFLIKCLIGAALIRLTVAGISRGSNDAQYWHRFATKAIDFGLLQAYRADSMLNHPLLMLMWAKFSLLVGGRSGFAFIFKLPAIFADLVSCVILAKIWLNRGDERNARRAIVAMAFNPLAILVSAYHCNTDSVFAMLSLLTMYFIAERKSFFPVGLALGAAINIKLIPILLIPAAASFCKSRKDLMSLIKGLAVWVIPFLPLLLVIDAVYHNMIVYVPQHERWGVALFLYEVFRMPGWEVRAQGMMDIYSHIGRGLIILSTLWFALVQARRNVWNSYELGLLTYAAFLVLAPGFGVQYTIMLLPLMIAVSINRTWFYSAAAGLFLFLAYFMELVPDQFPLVSHFVGPVLPMPSPLFGLVAWIILGDLVFRLGRRGWGAPAAL